MLRGYIFILLLLISMASYSQEKLYNILPMIEGQVQFEEVVPVENVSKDDLYKRAKKWIVETYKSANDVIQYDDPSGGEVIGKGFFEVNWQATFMHTYKVNVFHTVNIKVKDGRYKFVINGFRVKFHLPADKYSPPVDGDEPLETFNKAREKNAAKFASVVDAEMYTIVNSIKTGMKKSSKDDW